MVVTQKLRQDGTLMVPSSLLKAAGLTPGLGVILKVTNHTLVIEKRAGPPTPTTTHTLKRLRGCLAHIEWAAVRSDVRARWSAWREQLSA